MAVLLVGTTKREELCLLRDEVKRLGGDIILAEITDWPGASLTMEPDNSRAVVDTPFDIKEIDGGYFQAPALFRPTFLGRNEFVEAVEDVIPALHRLRDHRSLFESLCRTLETNDVPVLPRLHNHRLQHRKPWQLYRFEQHSLQVPDTVFTNEPDRLREFYDQHDRVIYKPVSKGAQPQELTEDDLTEERLGRLSNAPIQLQEFAPGNDVRVYVLDGEVIGAIRYESDAFSFKVDMANGQSVSVSSASISESVEETAVSAVSAVDLRFGAADIRSSSEGHALLEVNEAPAFAGADLEGDQDIAGAIADFLLG